MNRLALPLETERLIVRRFQLRDVRDILKYSDHEADDLHRRLNVGWKRTRGGVRAWWEPMIDMSPRRETKWLGLLIEVKELGCVVGNVGYSVRKVGEGREAMIGWIVGKRHEGNGYVTEAAVALVDYLFFGEQFHRVYAMTSADNPRSWRLMERLGMRQEARFLRNCCHDGEWKDEVVYAVLEEEWPMVRPPAYGATKSKLDTGS